MPKLVNLTLIVTFGVLFGPIKPAWGYLCEEIRALPTPGPCSCPEDDRKVLCEHFAMYLPSEDKTVLDIQCYGKELQFNHTTPLDVNFKEISKLEVHSCVVNVPLKDTLDRIGIRDVHSVLFDGGTRLVNRLSLSGLNLTKVKIDGENVALISDDDDDLLPDSNQLEEFHLCYSNISSLPNNFLNSKSRLKSLYVSDNTNLKILPEVLSIPSLETLYLYHNNISRITSTHFSLLRNLTLLDLKHNPIETISEDAFQANHALKTLHLRFDGAQLPEGIFWPLTMLEELRIMNGRLEHIQKGLFWNQTRLQILDLSGNRLTVLQGPIFIRLISLESLEINANNLRSVSREIFPNKLRNISFKTNNFTSIPFRPYDISPFNALHDLHELELGSNKLTDIGAWANHPSLEVLSLSHNFIRELNIDAIPRHLKYLDLSHNKIQRIEADENAPVRRQELKLSIEENPLEFDCRSIHFIQLVRKGTLKLTESKDIENLDIDRLYCDTEPRLCPKECNSCRLVGPKRQLVLNCSNKNLEKIPPIPPEIHLVSSSIVLDVRHNAIRLLPTVQSNPGFALINTLLLDNNQLESWSVSNLHSNLSMISWNNNSLYNLDRKLVESIMELPNLKQLYLLDNHWPCHCKLAKHMTRLQTKIVNFTALTCGSGTKLTEFEESCESDMLAFVLISSIIFALIVSGFAVYYRYQLVIRKWLFVNHLCLSCVSEADADTDFQYDAFISYSHRDEHFIVHELVPTLEAPPQKFRLCIHLRDFVPGMLIETQILNAITCSRRTIVYVTQNFLRSEWTRHEFRLAFEQSLRENRTRLIVILADDVRSLDELDPQLRVFFSTTTYLRRDDEKFWQKLAYAMPHRDAVALHRERKIQQAEQRLRNSSLREANRRREQLDLADVAL